MKSLFGSRSRVARSSQSPDSSPKTLRRPRWELHLKLSQFIALLILYSAVTSGIYYLGFEAGKSVGIESALSLAAVGLPKLPIIPPLEDTEGETSEKSEGSRTKARKSSVYDLLVKGEDKKIVAVATPSMLKKDTEGLEAIPRVNIDTKETPVPSVNLSKADIGKAKIESKDNNSLLKEKGGKQDTNVAARDLLDKVLTDRFVQNAKQNAKNTPTPVATASSKYLDGSLKKDQTGIKAADKLQLQLLRSGLVKKGWYVQVAAMTAEKEAQEAGRKLRDSGFPVIIEDVKVGNKQYYRILVGPEAAKETAQRMVGQVKSERIVVDDPFLRQIQ